MKNIRNRLLAALFLSLCSPLLLAAAADVEEARALLGSGQLDNALSKIESHLSGSPDDAEGRFLRGLILVKLNKTADALKVFAELTRDYPQLPEPYNNLAVIYAQQGDYEKARDALEAALATHPSYATAHENLGDIYAALAGAAYNRALSLDQANQGIRTKLNLVSQLDTQDRNAVPRTALTVSEPSLPPPAAPTPPTTKPETDAVTAAVQAWAKAWGARNLDAYFAAYDGDFKPENGLARGDWESQRRERIKKPQNISVSVSNIAITRVDGDRMQAQFRQKYTSDLLSNEITKVLELRNSGGAWKIVREFAR